MFLLLFLTILTVLCIIWFVADNYKAEPFVILLLVLLGGWVIAGNLWPLSNVKRDCPVNVITTDTTILLLNNDKVVSTLTSAADYKKLAGQTNIIVNQLGYVNMYGTTNWSSVYEVK